MHQDLSHLSCILGGPLQFPFILQGSDEVGRGPLAGPVVACTVSMLVTAPDDMKTVEELLIQWQNRGVNDSKKISSVKRRSILSSFGIQEFYCDLQKKEIGAGAIGEDTIYSLMAVNNVQVQFKIVSKSAGYIDRKNILNASLAAMWESGADLNQRGCHGVWYIDGNRIPSKVHYAKKTSLRSMGQRFDLIPIIQGDSKMLLIGLASIIAKEYRDFVMSHFALKYPQYGLEKHVGYATAAHLQALKRFGPCPIHRRTFSRVKDDE